MAAPASGRGRSVWAAAGLLGVLLALAFHGALAGRLFYLRDVVQNHAPVRQMVTDRLRAGDLPLWDPLHGGGMPLLANPNHLIAHPITVLFLALPFDVAFTASIVLQFVLLAAGGYLLARALPVGRPAATLAAAVLALSGPAASLASQQNVLSAFAWLPLALWGFVRGIERWRAVPIATAGVASAVILSTGEAASTLALLAYAPLLALMTTPAPDTPQAPPARRGALRIAALFVIAGLVAAVQIVPAAQLIALSPRAAGLDPAEAMKWSLAPARMAEIVLPRLFGDPTRLSPEAWWGGWLFAGGYPFLLSIVVGCGPCLLAATALGNGPGRRRALALAGAGAFFAVLAVGPATPLGRLVAALPAARQVRYPERFLLGTLVALALLAALGLERLERRRSGSIAPRLFGVAAGAGLVLATVLTASPTIADGLVENAFRLPSAFVASDSMTVVRGGLLRSLIWAVIDAGVVALGAVILARGGRGARLAAWGMVAGVGLSLTLASEPARSTAAPGWLHAPSPLAEVVGRGTGAGRLHHDPRPPGLQIWGRTDEQIWGYRFDRFSYSLLTGHPDGVPTMFDPATDRLDLATPAAIGGRLPGLAESDRLRLLRLAGVEWLATWETIDDPALEPAAVLEDLSRPPLRVYRVRGVPPRIRYAATGTPPAHPDDPVGSLLDAGFDPDASVLLESAPGVPTAPTVAPSVVPASTPMRFPQSSVRVLQDDPERLRIDVAAGRPGVLVVSDSYAPGWQARLDGQPIPILRANMMFRAVEVPAGRHEVEMTYAPRSLFAGAALSLLGVALLAFVSCRRAGEPA
jgi:membrane protein YfhO